MLVGVGGGIVDPISLEKKNEPVQNHLETKFNNNNNNNKTQPTIITTS